MLRAGTNEEQMERWARVKEMLGLTDLPFIPQTISIEETYDAPPKLLATFTRELTPYEVEQWRRIMTKPWPPSSDVDS